jgi:hypothetical protein
MDLTNYVFGVSLGLAVSAICVCMPSTAFKDDWTQVRLGFALLLASVILLAVVSARPAFLIN